MTNVSKAVHHIDIFPWDEAFSTGLPEVDQQHKHLIYLLNNIAGQVILNKSDVSLDTLIDELINYVLYHFKCEETYWLESLPQFPETAEHRENHKLFIGRIQEFKSSAKTVSEEQWLEEVLSFLASWLASHILEYDRRMVLLVEATQKGKSLDEANQWVDEQMFGVSEVILNTILTTFRNLTLNTLTLMREINASKITLDKLSETEHRFQRAMEYAQIGYWSLEYDGTVADWSPEMFQLFGMSREQTPGPQSLCGIMRAEFHQLFLCSMEESFQTGKDHYVEYPIIRPSDGQERWIECRGRVTSYKADGTPQSISGFIQDITERKASEEQITKLAYFDTLTGLPNRRLLFDRLHQAVNSCYRSKHNNALLFLDIDNFKTVNDTHGHEYGDALLKETAVRVRQCLRDSDTLARFGGDEFVVLLPELAGLPIDAAAQAKHVANKLLDSHEQPYELKELRYNSSVSIGIVLFNDNSRSESELLKQADIAMYRAKQSGKASACFFAPEMQAEIAAQFVLENELRTAIKEKQFELFYQPQMNQSNQVIGAEALIRWRHPINGLIPPDTFIPLSEKTGLIISIGEWVLETACQTLSDWGQSSKTEHLTLSVNVSYKQIRKANFVTIVGQLLQKYKVKRGKLRIELTESKLVGDMEEVISQMNALRSMGVHFSLDDFGTGYSSLKYLKRLPVSQLKIDRSFVKNLEFDLSDQSIVKAIISMSDALGLYTVAEGVEKKEQRTYLEKKGCKVYQGFLYSKALPSSEFDLYLHQHSLSSSI